MNRSLLIILLALATFVAAGVAVFAFAHEPSHVADWREKAARLDAYCRSIRTHYESERIDLANPSYRSTLLARMKEDLRTWKSARIDVCLRTPVDWAKREDCIHGSDFNCLIEMDSAIEASIGKR